MISHPPKVFLSFITSTKESCPPWGAHSLLRPLQRSRNLRSEPHGTSGCGVETRAQVLIPWSPPRLRAPHVDPALLVGMRQRTSPVWNFSLTSTRGKIVDGYDLFRTRNCGVRD